MKRANRLRGVALGLLAIAPQARALEWKASGRVTFGSSYRLEAADPYLLNTLNAAAAGLTGLAPGGQNSDDGNTNFRRHEATSTVLKGVLELEAGAGSYAVLLRLKAWHDFALLERPRSWGNSANGYTAGSPLGDAGAPALSRFSGVLLGDAYVQGSASLGPLHAFGRAGRQSLTWGEAAAFAGGLHTLNPIDSPALRRPGALAQETLVAVPALFGRLGGAELALEGFVQRAYRPSALEMCGSFWSLSDYMLPGCDKVFIGAPALSDRARLQSGAYLKRLALAPAGGAQHGLGLLWKTAPLAAEVGLYLARYTNRSAMPGLQKSSRDGAPVIAGDPDGRNMRYFTEYPEGVQMATFSYAGLREPLRLHAELSYRRGQAVMLAAGDVIGAFLSPTAPSLFRAEANALAPGALFHGYDRYNTVHAELGLRRDWSVAGWPLLAGGADAVAKHVLALPAQALRRYGRADQFGVGPINGACLVTTAAPAKQCSQDGYVSANAWAYRLRLEARWNAIAQGLNGMAGLVFTSDVKGWSYDNVVNQGRQTLNLALRLDYRQRYLAELVLTPVWGGDYNALGDRDLLTFALGIRF
ncbi:MAG: DUF1302 family protein [Pseudomonadota bacterium]